ncbi:hypothetical protein A9Q99_16000 [Gammaproteobacteria bacterium 45_16_T64]|nr:hypothetical protein A9Q99_16000 [Gammaproteobacteria bacterium 45_16_T64]
MTKSNILLSAMQWNNGLLSLSKGPRLYWLLPLIIVSASCSITPPPLSKASPDILRCSVFFSQLDNAIATHSHFEPGVVRISGYPSLRTNRFLSSYQQEALSPIEKNAWINELSRLGRTTYLIEAQRLPMTRADSLTRNLQQTNSQDAIQYCSKTLVNALIEHDKNWPLSLAMDKPEDSYSNIARFFGMYPLTSALAKPSIKQYQADMRRRLEKGAKDFSLIQRYHPITPPITRTIAPQKTETVPLSALTIQQQFSLAYAKSPLAIPQFEEAYLAQLFHLFSPKLQVESTSSSDSIGSPEWVQNADSALAINIDLDNVNAYRYLSFTRSKGNVLLQLNYAFWFPERPIQNNFDIYAGDIDGIIWRVTLDTTGKPWVYDSIHQCGCYHKVYMKNNISSAQIDSSIEEPLYFALTDDISHPVTLHIDANSHYIVDVSNAASNKAEEDRSSTGYELKRYDSLSYLPTTQGPKSLFDDDGIISQSARIERWFLWPLGVVNAGAMRQKGTHAIAFVGRRHFDDPFIFDDLGITKKP